MEEKIKTNKKKKEVELLPDFEPEEKEFLNNLGLGYSNETKAITVDVHSFRRALNDIANKDQEFLTIENEMMGIKVTGGSHSLTFPQLQTKLHDSLMFTQKNMPTRIPLGIG